MARILNDLDALREAVRKADPEKRGVVRAVYADRLQEAGRFAQAAEEYRRARMAYASFRYTDADGNPLPITWETDWGALYETPAGEVWFTLSALKASTGIRACLKDEFFLGHPRDRIYVQAAVWRPEVLGVESVASVAETPVVGGLERSQEPLWPKEV